MGAGYDPQDLEALLAETETWPCTYCREVPADVGIYIGSGYGDCLGTACAWCLGRISRPELIEAAWDGAAWRGRKDDSAYRGDGDQAVIEAMLRRAFIGHARRRRPDAPLRSEDEAAALWDEKPERYKGANGSNQIRWWILAMLTGVTAQEASDHLSTEFVDEPRTPRTPFDEKPLAGDPRT